MEVGGPYWRANQCILKWFGQVKEDSPKEYTEWRFSFQGNDRVTKDRIDWKINFCRDRLHTINGESGIQRNRNSKTSLSFQK